MAKYALTNEAVEDLSEIWDCTYEFWSESQADKYFELLIDACGEVAENPGIRKSYDEIDKNILGCSAGKHIVFYHIIQPNVIVILRILYERMDLKNRIAE